MAGDEGVDTNEKVLIIASAVLGTILVSLLCFAALYKSFLAQYASAYDNHVKMLNPFSADMVGRPDSALAGASAPGSPGLNQVQIKLASSPSTNDFEVVQPAPKIAETSFGSGNIGGKATSPAAEGHGGTTPAWGSPSNEADEGEFFSADEQARIWAELREAEKNAASVSVSVDAARAAAAEAATGEYVETFASTANIGMAQSVSAVNVNSGALDDDDDDDANTKFGFDEADLNMSGMSSNVGSPIQSPAQPPDYIDGNHLEATGQTFSGPGSPGSPMGVNADNEWWK